jgi:hypothetical protein
MVHICTARSGQWSLDHIRVLQANGPAEAMDALGVKRSEWEAVDFKTANFDRCGLIRDWR